MQNLLEQQLLSNKKTNGVKGFLKNMRMTIETKIEKELTILKAKINDLKKGYNLIMREKQIQKNKLNKAEKEYDHYFKMEEKINIKKLSKVNKQLDHEIQKANQKYRRAKLQEQRLQKIIEICFINKDLNEEWIRVRPKPPNLSATEFLHLKHVKDDRKEKKVQRKFNKRKRRDIQAYKRNI